MNVRAKLAVLLLLSGGYLCAAVGTAYAWGNCSDVPDDCGRPTTTTVAPPTTEAPSTTVAPTTTTTAATPTPTTAAAVVSPATSAPYGGGDVGTPTEVGQLPMTGGGDVPPWEPMLGLSLLIVGVALASGAAWRAIVARAER